MTAYSLLVKVIYKSQLIKEVMLPQHYYQEKVFSTLHFRVTVFVLLESPVPREELVEFELDNDVLKIDGNMAIAWSSSLQFTTENASKSIVGSTLSGEGVVNVYRGTGKVLVAPTMNGTVNPSTNGPEQTTAKSGSDSLVGSIVGGMLI